MFLASILSYLVAHQHLAQSNFTDLLQGLLYGISFASLLKGARCKQGCPGCLCMHRGATPVAQDQ